MKWLGGCLGMAVLGLVFIGCDSGGSPQVDPGDVSKDGRPAGFEDMMKGMAGQMKKGANPKAAASSTNAPAK